MLSFRHKKQTSKNVVDSTFYNNYIEYESRGDKDKTLSVRKYLFMIIQYLRDMINSYKAAIRDSSGIIIEDDLSGEWKIQSTMQINFVSSLDPREICVMDSKSGNIEITIGNETISLKDCLNLQSVIWNFKAAPKIFQKGHFWQSFTQK